MQWWLANADADVDEVVALVQEYLEEHADRWTTSRDDDPPCDDDDDDGPAVHESWSASVVRRREQEPPQQQQQQQQPVVVRVDDDDDSEESPEGAQPSRCAYVPAAWEARWAAQIAEYASDDPEWPQGCAAMRADSGAVRRWLEWIRADKEAALVNPPRTKRRRWWQEASWRPWTTTTTTASAEAPAEGALPFPTDVFSRFDGAGCASADPIEPLVGHLRDPRFHCVGDDRDTIQVMFSTEYLVLASAAGIARRNAVSSSSSQNYFFDAGASVVFDNCWWGCTKWFVDEYERRGIRFDRLFLWEARTDVDHAKYWRTVPADLKPRITYVNAPLEADATDPRAEHLWTHVRAVARPEDFVAVKLDIDNHDIECAIVRELLRDDSLVALVDEFFWEHHVHGSPLKKTRVDFYDTKGIGWGDQVPDRASPDSSLVDSYFLFAELRRRGIRAHGWI